MAIPHWFSILSAVLGSAVISLGMVLQKKGVSWFKWKRPKDAQYRSLRSAWLSGFALNNLLSFFYFFALKGLPASVVGAMMGLNIVFTAVFSRAILKEPIAKRVAVGSLAMVGFIVMANLSTPSGTKAIQPPTALIVAFFAAPFLLVALATAARRWARLGDRFYGVAFAAASGALEGIIIVLIKSMQAAYGNDVLRYVFTPFLYMYAVSCFAVIIFMQTAYSHCKMTSVGPVLWAMQIIYPVLISYVAFSLPLVPLELASFAGILACAIIVQTKR